jgi:hypothetical protein
MGFNEAMRQCGIYRNKEVPEIDFDAVTGIVDDGHIRIDCFHAEVGEHRFISIRLWS